MDIKQWTHVQHPEDASRDAWVVLTPSLTGDVLVDALAGLRHISGGLAPVAVWRVEDLDL